MTNKIAKRRIILKSFSRLAELRKRNVYKQSELWKYVVYHGRLFSNRKGSIQIFGVSIQSIEPNILDIKYNNKFIEESDESVRIDYYKKVYNGYIAILTANITY